MKLEKMEEQNDQLVTSVWGKITRRELLKRMAIGGLVAGVGGMTETLWAQKKTVLPITPDDAKIKSPYRDIVGQPFRKFAPPKGSLADLIKNAAKNDEKNGKPKPRRRDAFWYSKPNSALDSRFFNTLNHPIIYRIAAPRLPVQPFCTDIKLFPRDCREMP
jgi:hypothetical protein